MKKLTLATLACLFSATAFAAPVGNTFTGVGVGVDVSTIKYKANGAQGKQSTGPALVVDYGFEQSNNFIGFVQAKAKIGSAKVFNEIKQKNQYSLAYQQGYRVGSDLVPYAKVDLSSSKIGDETFRGFGFGVGAKYAVSSDVEIGTEYTRANLKRSGTKLTGNQFSANATYRF